jgi:hypothetical protein
VSNCQAVVFIVRIPVEPLGVCRVLMPEVTCVPSQLVQLLVFFIFGLRARGNRDRSGDDKVSNRQAVVFIRRIPMKVLCVFRVSTPKVTCVLSQRVQLLFFLDLRLRARGNRDKPQSLSKDWRIYTSSSRCRFYTWITSTKFHGNVHLCLVHA